MVKRLTENFLGCYQIKGCDNFTCEETCNNVLNCGCCPISEAINKLAEYENLEEQGLLFRLPCGIGDDVYFIPSKTNYKLNILQGHPDSNRVYHQNVEKITFTPNGWYLECDKDLEYSTDHILIDKLYKETWFLSQAEAEQKLKEMEV